MNGRQGTAERGVALLAVLFALTLLMLLALPFAVSMSIGADAAMRDVEQVAVEQASASVRDLLLADAALSHPALDPSPGYDGLDEWPAGVELPPAFAPLAGEGRMRLGGEVVDLQRFLALDSASPLLLANVLGTATRLREDLLPEATGMVVEDATTLPETGFVWVGGEVVRYGRKQGNTLLQLERGALRDQGLGDGQQPISEQALVLDYRCVLAASWPWLGRGDETRQTRRPWRAIGELVEIAAAGCGSFDAAELETLAAAFTVDALADNSPVWSRPERVFNDLQPGLDRTLTVRSALQVGAGSTVRLRDLRSGAVEYGLVMASSSRRPVQELQLPSVFQLDLLLPVLQPFRGVDTIVEALVPAPVNVNTASEDVLAAVFAEVRRATDLRVPEANQRRAVNPEYIRRATARELAAQIAALRSGNGRPLAGWQDFVERVFGPRLEAAGTDQQRQAWVVLYRNLETARDSTVEMGTAPLCFRSGPLVAYRAAASSSRSLAAPGVAARHERRGIAAAVPGMQLERAWRTQVDFEDAFQLDRRAPFWITAPINLGALQPGAIGNDPAPRFFPHVVPVAYPGLGLGAPRFAVADPADSGIEPATAVAPASDWGLPSVLAVRAYDSFAQENHWRGRDLGRDGVYRMNNTGPAAFGAGAGAAQSAGGRRHDQLAFPFSRDGGFLGRFAQSFWLEPQSLDAVVIAEYGDGDPNRNRLALLGQDGNLLFEVVDEAGIDPNPSDSPAGITRTASQVVLPLAELGLPANTPVHLSASAPDGRPASLALHVDGMVRGRPRLVTYLTAPLPAFDPTLANNQRPPVSGTAGGNDYFIDLQVESTDGFPPMGVVRIGLELFEYSSISGNTLRCQWNDSVGGRGARQIGREHRPQIPLDQNGNPRIDIDDPQLQGINLDVFPAHPAGAMVELYGYAALLSEDTPMMTGSTVLGGGLGGFAVARGFVQNPRPIVIQLPQGPSFPIGAGIDETWVGDLELADPVPTRNYPPNQAGAEVADAFSTDGGYALLVQRWQRWDRTLTAVGAATQFGGVELIRYTARQGTRLTGVQRAQLLPGQDGQISRDEYDGTARRFVCNYEDYPLPNNPQLIFDDLPTLILFVVPVSISVQNASALWDPQVTQLTEWAQLLPPGNPNDTEWVRYDTIADRRFLVRANRAAWDRVRFALTTTNDRSTVQVGPLGPGTALPDTPATPPWPPVAPTSGFIGYTPQLESRFPQIHAARRALSFRGDPFTGTSAHPQNNAVVLPCHRLQLNWGNYGALSGRVGRHDRVALVQGSTANGGSRPVVEWHTVHWQARRFNADNLQANVTPAERLGPWPFQLVGFRAAVRNLYLGPPRGTAIDDPRRFDRVVKFPSGELPAAFCPNPAIGGGVGGAQPVRGLLDEVEVVGHLAPDLLLDDVLPASGQTFVVNRNATATSAGALWFQNDLSAAFPPRGGLVQIDSEILAYQVHQDGVFTIAANGRGLLNTLPRDHARGARVSFLTQRPAAILAGSVGPREASLPLQAMSALPRSGGTVLLGQELLHYTWARSQGDRNTLEMPRWFPPENSDDTRARGLFRARYGTVPQGASSGSPVIGFPFRFWDRYAADSDDPELAYFQLTLRAAPAVFRALRWREETRDPRVGVVCRVRADALVPWTADPATTPALYELRGGSASSPPHRLDRHATMLEIRFQSVYRPGAVDLVTFRAHGWKTTARIEDVIVEYEGQGRVFREEVTAR